MGIVNIKNVNKQYPGFQLRDVSFELEKGKISGFIGRNGAGKTTTIKAMLGLIHADSGEVDYMGMPFSGNEDEIKQRIGYSVGSSSFYPRKTIGDILAVTKRFYRNWDEAACRQYLEMFGLDTSKKPIELSEGMKVKFNLLMALSHRAEVLILDEPTSGLDPFSRNELLEVFNSLKEEGATLLYSTHIISDIEKCADNIIYISQGRIRADCGKADFRERFAEGEETLEETFLRLERGVRE